LVYLHSLLQLIRFQRFIVEAQTSLALMVNGAPEWQRVGQKHALLPVVVSFEEEGLVKVLPATQNTALQICAR